MNEQKIGTSSLKEGIDVKTRIAKTVSFDLR